MTTYVSSDVSWRHATDKLSFATDVMSFKCILHVTYINLLV